MVEATGDQPSELGIKILALVDLMFKVNPDYNPPLDGSSDDLVPKILGVDYETISLEVDKLHEGGHLARIPQPHP